MLLLPPDHPVGGIIQDEHNQVEAKPDRGFYFLRIHHEPAIAANRQHAALWPEHRRHHGRRQPGSHRCQCVVEQNGIGLMRDVIAGEPNLVDAIVESDDVVPPHDPAHIGNHALRYDREPCIVTAATDMRGNFFVHTGISGQVARLLAAKPLSQTLHRTGNIADNLQLRKIDLVDLGGLVIDVNDGLAAGLHEEGRLFDNVMANVDDQIGALDGAMNIVVRRQCRGAEI